MIQLIFITVDYLDFRILAEDFLNFDFRYRRQIIFFFSKGKWFENYNFSGTASIDIKEISEYPLNGTENEIISNVLDVKAIRIENMLGLDTETFQIMKEKLSKK